MTLRCAAYDGDADQVKQLLAKGAPVDKTDARGMTPLHYASDQNHPAVAAILLNHHASVDLTNDNGMTPLHFAARNSKTDVMRHLLAAGASRDIADAFRGTPLQCAEMNNQTAAVELLNEWPETLAVEEVNIQMHAVSQVMGGLIRTVWQELPQAMDSLDLEQAIEEDLKRVAGEVCEDGKWKRWV